MRHAAPLAAAAAAALSLVAACDAPVPPPHAAIDATTLQPLLERLDRLIAALRVGAGAPVVAAPPGGPSVGPANATADRVRVAASDSELVRRIEALEHQLARLAGGPTRGRATPYAGEPPAKTSAAIAPLIEQLITGEDRLRAPARRAVFHLDEQQVLQRFGVPDQVEPEKNGLVHWRYSDGERTFAITFLAGLAVDAQAW